MVPVGTHGLRALTSAHVDEQAGLPKGSTSDYFRTRQALKAGVVNGILERELPAVDVAFSPSSSDELVNAPCALFDHMTTVNRTVTASRLVFYMEASHNAELRDALSPRTCGDGSPKRGRPGAAGSPRTTHRLDRGCSLLRGTTAAPNRPARPHRSPAHPWPRRAISADLTPVDA